MEMVWSIFWVPVGREGRRSATAKLTVCVYAAVHGTMHAPADRR